MDLQDLDILVKRLQNNDEAAFKDLYDKTSGYVYYLAYKSLNSKDDIGDVVQSVFMRIFTDIKQLREPKALMLWIGRIVSTECRTVRRDQSRVSIFENDDYIERKISKEDLDSEFIPEKAMETEESRKYIAQLIEKLPSKQKDSILMYYFEQLSLAEIAESMESTVNAISKHICRARDSLKKRIELDMQEEGKRAYMGVGPLPFLTLILQEEFSKMQIPTDLINSVWESVHTAFSIGAIAGITTVAGTNAAAGTTALKSTISATRVASHAATGAKVGTSVAAKVVIGVLVAGGLSTGAYLGFEDKKPEAVRQVITAEPTIKIEHTAPLRPKETFFAIASESPQALITEELPTQELMTRLPLEPISEETKEKSTPDSPKESPVEELTPAPTEAPTEAPTPAPTAFIAYSLEDMIGNDAATLKSLLQNPVYAERDKLTNIIAKHGFKKNSDVKGTFEDKYYQYSLRKGKKILIILEGLSNENEKWNLNYIFEDEGFPLIKTVDVPDFVPIQ